MEKTKLHELLLENKKRFFSKIDIGEYIPREIQYTVAPLLNTKEILFITGIRRSGKSTLLLLIAKDLMKQYNVPIHNLFYFNFEDERCVDFTLSDFSVLYELYLELENPIGKKYFFIDEIQSIPGWERWVNRMYENEDCKFFITGSNTSLLSSDISTTLTGRNIQIVNYPFSFKEFLKCKNVHINDNDVYITETRATIKHLLHEYMQIGGFPEAAKTGSTILLENYFRDILYSDIIARHKIRNSKEIRELALYCISNIATIQSFNAIKKFLKIKSITSVKKYLQYFEDVYLFYFINLFDYSVKRQIYNPSKLYIADIGLYNAIGFKYSQNIGHSIENILFNHLIRGDKDIFYWKSKNGLEVDYIIRQGYTITDSIQVTATIENPVVKDREIRALLSAKNELNPHNLIIITMDDEQTCTIDNTTISVIPLWKWLLFH